MICAKTGNKLIAMKQCYEELFENSAYFYDEQLFVRGSEGEVDFIVQEIAFNKSAAMRRL